MISLLTLHLAGYLIIFRHEAMQLEERWQSRFIANDFENLSLEQMTLDISFPYLADQEDFVLVDEEMEIDSKVFRIVKKRYHNNQLEIVYVNDHDKEDLNDSINDWQKEANSDKSTSGSQINLNISYQYYSNDNAFNPIVNTIKLTHSYLYINLFNSIELDVTSPPPNFS